MTDAEYKFLDLDGLTTYDNKIKDYFNDFMMKIEEVQALCDEYLVSDGESISDAIDYILNKPV